MVKRLRAGHRVLRTCGIDPGSLDPSAWRHAKAPQSGRDRQLGRLALLAPDLQRAMLSGEVTNPLDGGVWNKVPLSWAAQQEMFATIRPSTSENSTEESMGSAEHPHSRVMPLSASA
jgi:hypothetical protein